MKQIRRWLCMLLALIMATVTTVSLAEGTVSLAEGPAALTGGALTLAAVEDRAGDAARVHTDAAGNVVFLDGSCADGPVMNADDAADVVASMSALLGGDARTRFEPWRTLTDTSGNRYYVFRQMYADTTVSGGAVKVVTDADGNMLGLVSSVESELPDTEESRGITAGEAEAVVLAHAQEDKGATLAPISGCTEKVILPVNLEIDMSSDDVKQECHFVWAVYTDNPGVNGARGSDLPYLAHYVTMDGQYLYSLPTIMPGDEAGASGFDAAYVFEFMEPATYTGEVTLSDGTKREITVELMKDGRTGMYYLGNLKRRIAVADCYEFLYDGGTVVLQASADNTGWDDTCLLSLYNYCKAWDYYDEIGWTGGDGLGTPMLILKDFCDKDHNPVDNACYAGHYYGWQVFLSSAINDFSQCLDVLAHEFTHCVTDSVMTFNAYMNDYGAINEAMSDIHGNICQKLMEGDEDPDWLMGENGMEAVRSMSDPHRYNQPEYTWDVYYTPKVKTPTEINDRGGVHSNSSLLNNVAYRLCTDGGMTLEDARTYWFAVDCTMVPGNDYAQLSQLLPWVLRNLGMEKYADALEAAIDATRLRTDEMPERFDDDRALVTLQLPDDARFDDGNWVLFIASLDLDGLIQRLDDIGGKKGECAGALDELYALLGIDEATLAALEKLEESGGEADALIDRVFDMMEKPDADTKELIDGLKDWYKRYFGDVVYIGNSGAGQDGLTIRMVCRRGLSLPVLMRAEMSPDSELPVTLGFAVYTMGRWFDLSGVAKMLAELDPGEEQPEEGAEVPDEEVPEIGPLGDLLSLFGDGGEGESDPSDDPLSGMISDALVDMMPGIMNNLSWLKNLIFFEIKGGEVCEIPNTGLEDVNIIDEETTAKLAGGFSDEQAAEPPKSPAEAAGIDTDAQSLDELTALRDELNQIIEQRQ